MEKFHRLDELRTKRKMSLLAAARARGIGIREAAHELHETTDLDLLTLASWCRILGVTIDQVLVDENSLMPDEEAPSPEVLQTLLHNAHLILRSRRPAEHIDAAAELNTLLVEIMPELKEISPWQKEGLRSVSELGERGEH